ncbi:MAG: hypothetical protein ACRDD8_05425 [Bacteroidales bacterium]
MAKKEENLSKKIKGTFLSSEIESIAKSYNLRTFYDMNLENAPERIIYTDFMNCLGGVYVCSGCTFKNEIMINEHLNGGKYDYTEINYTEKIISALDDKYSLLPHLSKKKIDKIVILPGSNIIQQIVDDKKLIRAVAEGAYVKPHPMTSREDLKYLNELFGSKCIHHMIGGAQLIKNAKEVYVTGSSELFMYAIMLGKVVHDISKNTYIPKGGYQAIFKIVTAHKHYERPIVLNKILSYKHGGIIFPFDEEQKDLENFIYENFKEDL